MKLSKRTASTAALFTAAAGLFWCASAPRAQAAVPPGYTLTWSDEFNGATGSAPNSANWTFDLGGGGWGNGELETYVNDAAHCSVIADSGATDGKSLRIVATNAGGVYQSARINSIGKNTPTFGYIEIRAKNPIGKGIWPAFWMLGTDFPTDSWPNCGEQDIMEQFESAAGTNMSSWHMNYLGNGVDWSAPYTLAGGATFNQAYHTFGMLWTQTSVNAYVDGVLFETHASQSPGWVFNHPYYYILNLAVGGGPPGNPDGTTTFPQNLDVDYIRCYTAPATSPGSGTVTDPCNDLSVAYNTSGNWIMDNSNPTFFNGDSGRLSRIFNATEFVNYKYKNISAATVTVGTNTTDTTIVSLWYSTDNGATYTQSATSASAITPTASGWGLYTISTSGSLPAGVTDLKIQEAPSINSWDHQIANVVITSAAPTVPVAPTNLGAIPGGGAVYLSWIASSGGSTYNVYRGTSPGGESSTPYATGDVSTTYGDLSVVSGTTYYYKVAAVNGAGTSALSTEVSSLGTSGGGTAPGQPSGLVATAGNTQVALVWASTSGATSYNVFRSTTAGGEGGTPLVSGVTTPSYTNTGLTNGTKYFYTVAAVNASGTSIQSAEVNATPVASIPAVPTGVVASAGNAQVTVTWAASSGATGYSIYRSTTAGGEGTTAFATVGNVTTYTNTGLTNGTKYFYKVAASNASGTSGQSSEVSATPSAGSIPATPTGVGASGGNAQVTVTWTLSSGATSYNIYRSLTTGTEGSTVFATVGNVATYTNTGLTNGTKYFYKVAAVNSVGTSSQSSEVSATPAAGSTGAVSINCGGSAASPFVADTDFSGGTTSTTTSAIDTTLCSVPAPPQAVLQSNRHGAMTYTLGGFTAGTGHVVSLYFVENSWSASGARVFNVAINGTTVLTHFDIFANTGVKFKAIQENFNATANSSGQIVITFTAVTDNPIIQGIVSN